MNSPGEHEAALGMVPAHQRLEAADLVALEIDDRLVVQLELAVGERLAQIELAAAPRACMCASISGSKKRWVPRPSLLAR